MDESPSLRTIGAWRRALRICLLWNHSALLTPPGARLCMCKLFWPLSGQAPWNALAHVSPTSDSSGAARTFISWRHDGPFGQAEKGFLKCLNVCFKGGLYPMDPAYPGEPDRVIDGLLSLTIFKVVYWSWHTSASVLVANHASRTRSSATLALTDSLPTISK